MKEKRKHIQEIVNAGIFPVLARVHEEAGLKTGLELGLKLFQGFYFDSQARAH